MILNYNVELLPITIEFIINWYRQHFPAAAENYKNLNTPNFVCSTTGCIIE